MNLPSSIATAVAEVDNALVTSPLRRNQTESWSSSNIFIVPVLAAAAKPVRWSAVHNTVLRPHNLRLR